MDNQPIIIIGNGGHAKVLTECLLLQNRKIIGFLDKVDSINQYGIPYLGDDSKINTYNPKHIQLVNGIGSTSNLKLRKEIFLKFKQMGFEFTTVIHPSSIISTYSLVSEGVQILAGAILQPFSKIGQNSIINTKASIDHDCIIGGHCHIAPGVCISGNVIVKDESHIGTGACIIQNITIGKRAVIGAGSVVLNDISDGKKAYGVPCKEAT